MSPNVRTALIFLLVGGLALGLVVHLAGGLTVGEGGDEPVRPTMDDDGGYSSVVPGGIKVGRTRSGHVERRATAVVDGEPAPYVAWELRFDASEHRDHPEPDVRSETLSEATIWFYPEPTPENPTPKAEEGPDTSRLDARTAHATWREAGESNELRAELEDDVVVTWFLSEGERTERPTFPGQQMDRAVLRTDQLLLGTRPGSSGDVRTIHSDAAVRFEAPGGIVDGTGLEGELEGDAPTDAGVVDLRLASDVAARFLSRDGALPGDGGETDAPVEVTITCSGPCRIERTLDRDELGLPLTRWRLHFSDDVHLRQATGRTATCDELHIDYVLPAGEAGRFERVIAEGNFRSKSSDESDQFLSEAGRAEFWRDADGSSHGVLTDDVRIEFETLPRATAQDGSTERGRQGRLVATCTGRAELETEPRRDRPEWLRSRVRLYDDVVVEATPEGADTPEVVLRAPEVMIAGNRVDRSDGERPLDPETLTAQGGVEIDYRDDVRSTSQVATWTRALATGRDAFLLSGDPVVRFRESGGLNPFGGVKTSAETTGSWVLSAREIRVLGEVAPESADGASRVGETEFLAQGTAVLRKQVGETEPLVLRADTLTARGRAEAVDSVVAQGSAELEGAAEDGSGLSGRLEGHRIALSGSAKRGDETGVEQLAGAIAVGRGDEPARARLTTREDGGESRHELQAGSIRYTGEGRVLEATRGAEAWIQYDPKTSPSDRLHIAGQKLEAHLAPVAEDPTAVRLETVVAEDRVRMDGRGFYVVADRVTYDHADSSAVANGRPARIVGPAELGPAFREPREDFVRSPTIRVWFDPTSKETDDRLRRATCQGGNIQSWIVGEEDGVPTLHRVIANATGPIVVERDRMSAVDDVDVRYDRALPGGGYERTLRLQSDALVIELDPSSSGEHLEDSWRRLLATSRGKRLVQLDGQGMEASAYRVENVGPWLHLEAGGGERVWARRDEPQEAMLCQRLSVNLDTWEWRDWVAAEWLTE